MSFFDSDIVQSELKEIKELQKIIYSNIFTFPSLCKEEKMKHIEYLETLLCKQKTLYTRLSLSDDKDAIKLKKHIESSAVEMGMKEGMDINLIFNNLHILIRNMKNQLYWLDNHS